MAQAALPTRSPAAAAMGFESRAIPSFIVSTPKGLKLQRELKPDDKLVVPIPQASPAYKYTFRVLSEHPTLISRYDEFILRSAQQHGMDPRLVKAFIAAESEFSPEARSPRGAQGLMQVLPITAREFGLNGADLKDPETNVRVGTAYLERLYQAAWKKYRLKGVSYREAPLWIVERIIASYNAGPRALTRGSYERQTRNYVRKVLLFYQSDVSEFRRDPSRFRRPGLPREDFQP